MAFVAKAEFVPKNGVKSFTVHSGALAIHAIGGIGASASVQRTTYLLAHWRKTSQMEQTLDFTEGRRRFCGHFATFRERIG
jgi:hypothetical protein